MPQAIPTIAAAVTTTATGAAIVEGVLTVALIAGTQLLSKKLGKQKIGIQGRQINGSGTIEPDRRIYGQELVGGALTFIATEGPDDQFLWHVITFCEHEVDAITDVYLDGVAIAEANIGGGGINGGAVSAGKFAPVSGTNVAFIRKHQGQPGQTADSDLVTFFPNFFNPVDHTAPDTAYIATRFHVFTDSEVFWSDKEVGRISALVRGAKVFDPREPAHDVNDSTSWEWSDNPALCTADYLINVEFGFGAAPDEIDWDMVIAAANYCDETVITPIGQQKRYTCNGVLFATNSHRDNLTDLVSSMVGPAPVWTAGKWRIRAGGNYEAYAADPLTADQLRGVLEFTTALPRQNKVNTLTAIYVDRDQAYKPVTTNDVTRGDQVTVRDGGKVIRDKLELPFTNNSYEAFRNLWYRLGQTDERRKYSFPANLEGLKYEAGQRLTLQVSDLGQTINGPYTVNELTWAEAADQPIAVNLQITEHRPETWGAPTADDYPEALPTGSGGSVGGVSPSVAGVTHFWNQPQIGVYEPPFGSLTDTVEFTDGTTVLDTAIIETIRTGNNVSRNLTLSAGLAALNLQGAEGTPLDWYTIRHVASGASTIVRTGADTP